MFYINKKDRSIYEGKEYGINFYRLVSVHTPYEWGFLLTQDQIEKFFNPYDIYDELYIDLGGE